MKKTKKSTPETDEDHYDSLLQDDSPKDEKVRESEPKVDEDHGHAKEAASKNDRDNEQKKENLIVYGA